MSVQSPLVIPVVLIGGLQPTRVQTSPTTFWRSRGFSWTLRDQACFLCFSFVLFRYEFVTLDVVRWWQIEGDEFVYTYIFIYACIYLFIYAYFFVSKIYLHVYIIILNIPNLKCLPLKGRFLTGKDAALTNLEGQTTQICTVTMCVWSNLSCTASSMISVECLCLKAFLCLFVLRPFF